MVCVVCEREGRNMLLKLLTQDCQLDSGDLEIHMQKKIISSQK